MRVIGGKLKGKLIHNPTDKTTRPLKDMVRESIFNILEHSKNEKIKFKNDVVLDLFSGSGSFGIECLSRGVKKVFFFENYKPSLKILEKNIKELEIDKDSVIKEINAYEISKENIDNAVKIFRKNDCSFELMHCVSAYPFNDENADLGLISYLKEKFKCNVGYSGHEKGGYAISFAATALGISSLERHFTLDRTMYGSDQAASLEMKGMVNLVNSINIWGLLSLFCSISYLKS